MQKAGTSWEVGSGEGVLRTRLQLSRSCGWTCRRAEGSSDLNARNTREKMTRGGAGAVFGRNEYRKIILPGYGTFRSKTQTPPTKVLCARPWKWRPSNGVFWERERKSSW